MPLLPPPLFLPSSLVFVVCGSIRRPTLLLRRRRGNPPFFPPAQAAKQPLLGKGKAKGERREYVSKRNAGRWVGLWTKWHLATFVYAVRRTEQICGDGERFVNFCDFQHNIPVYLRAKTYCTLAGPLKKGAAAGRGVLVRTLCQADMVPELPHAVGECSSVNPSPPLLYRGRWLCFPHNPRPGIHENFR